jgi:hypothetical protein
MSTFELNRSAFAALLAGDEGRAAGILRRVDATSLVQFVTANKLEFHIATLDADSPVRAVIAPELLRTIDVYWQSQAERQQSLLDELWRLADVFEAAGIEFVLLKGLYFAERYYGGIENRFSWDLDVLVRCSEAASADRVLRSSGYFRRSAVVLSRSLTSNFTHAFDYGNERPRFSVDLHWLLSRHPSFRVDEDAIWKHREDTSLYGRRFSVLSPEYEVVSNALSTFRDIQRGAIRLRALVDLYKVLELEDARIDWNAFFDKRQEERIAGIAVNVLALLFELLECEKRFPGAAGLLDRSRERLVSLPGGDAETLFAPGRAALANRAWTSNIYECSRARVAVWWLVSLPFRMAVYKSGRRYANLKRRVHVLKRRLRGEQNLPAAAGRRPMP